MITTAHKTNQVLSSNFVTAAEAVQWFVLLRWCSIIGQIFIVATAFWWLSGHVLILPISFFIFAALISNILLNVIVSQISKTKKILGYVLILDVGLLTGLLYYSGGPSNPFSIIYLVYIVLGAILLGKKFTWLVAGLAVFCYGLLFFFSAELPWYTEQHQHHAQMEGSFSLHLQGMWFAFVIAAILMAYFLTKIIDSLKRAEEALNHLAIKSLKQQRLAALTTMAAGAAHELGTPLATIALVTSELKHSLKNAQLQAEVVADLNLIDQEVARCKTILEQMSAKAGSLVGEMPQLVNLQVFAKQVQASLSPERNKKVESNIVAETLDVIVPEKAILLSLQALINNAFDASSPEQIVTLKIKQTGQTLIFEVVDTGTGIAADILDRIGEPFFTTKGAGSGLGLGVFLAQLTAEQLGGKLTISSIVGQGTTVEFILPL